MSERCDRCAWHGGRASSALTYCWRFMLWERVAYHCPLFVDEAEFVAELIGSPDLDLTAAEPFKRCGDCVVWNGQEGDAAGGCSVMGERPADAVACRRWFPKTQLNAPRYGRTK